MSMDDFIITRLSEEDRDNLIYFDCYNPDEYSNVHPRKKRMIKAHSVDMNIFLQDEALEEQNDGYNTTYLLKDRTGTIVAYLSLCADAIRLNYAERDNGHIGYEMFPSLKIARLAVHRDYQKQGIGRHLINYAVSKAIIMRETIGGVIFITLDCFSHRLAYYLDNRLGFVKNGLQATNGERNKPISLRLHIDDYLDKLV